MAREAVGADDFDGVVCFGIWTYKGLMMTRQEYESFRKYLGENRARLVNLARNELAQMGMVIGADLWDFSAAVSGALMNFSLGVGTRNCVELTKETANSIMRVCLCANDRIELVKWEQFEILQNAASIAFVSAEVSRYIVFCAGIRDGVSVAECERLRWECIDWIFAAAVALFVNSGGNVLDLERK